MLSHKTAKVGMSIVEIFKNKTAKAQMSNNKPPNVSILKYNKTSNVKIMNNKT